MADILFSSLSDNQTIAFDPNSDVLRFDQWWISAASLDLRFNDTNTEISLAAGGKTIFLPSQLRLSQLGIANFSFPDGSKLVLGDGLTSETDDANGNFVISGTDGADYFYGLAGNDDYNSGAGDDTLNGGAGNDMLNGGTGNDVLAGGQGNDNLEGQRGNDIYLIDRTSGNDTISDFQSRPGEVDAILYGDTITPSDIVVTRDDVNLYLSIRGTDTRTTIAGYFWNPDTHTDTVSFADGRFFRNLADYAVPNESSEGKDTIYGSTHADTIDALGGNDSVYGFEGDDQIHGGGGDDALFGHDGNDTLSGDAGQDLLEAGYGNDTYLFGRGYGQDVILDENFDPAGLDIIKLGANILPSDITLARSGDKLVLSINGTQDRLTVLNQFTGGIYRIEEIHFADGTVRQIEDNIPTSITEGDDFIFGTPQSETIDALGGNDFISGKGGKDILHGGAGDDILHGDDDTDVLDGGEGVDRMFGHAGDDLYVVDTQGDQVSEEDFFDGGIDTVQSSVSYTLPVNIENLVLTGSAKISGFGNALDNHIIGNAGNNFLSGDLGNDVLEGLDGNDALDGGDGDDTLLGGGGSNNLGGGAGNDILIGGAGTNYLSGGAGDDLYLIDRTSGNYTLYEYADTADDQDAIVYGENIVPLDIIVTRDKTNLYLSIRGTNAVTKISDYYIDFFKHTPGHLDEVRFADGRVFHNIFDYVKPIESREAGTDIYGSTHADIVNGLGGTDYIYGMEGYDQLNGGGGDDKLYGHYGNDTLSGDAGNDYLEGGHGNDTYLFDRGDGQDVFFEGFSQASGFDIIKLGEDILPSDLTLVRSGWDLVLSINGPTDRITVQNQFHEDGIYGIEEIHFSDGTVWNLDEHAPPVATEGDDVIYGTKQADTLDGLGGNDVIRGQNGNNILRGGAGNDTLEGGMDTDVLSGDSGIDTMQGRGGDDLYIVDNPGDQVIEGNGDWGSDTVQSGVSYTLPGDIENLVLTGSANLSGFGNELGNRIIGNAGNNLLSGGLGNDTYVMGRGYGSDTIVENDATAGNTDVASFLEDIATAQLWFRHVGNNLEVSIIGTADTFTIRDWYSGDARHVEAFHTADGGLLLDDNVENLVQAMAAFAPPSAGQTTLPPDYAVTLTPVIAANWQ